MVFLDQIFKIVITFKEVDQSILSERFYFQKKTSPIEETEKVFEFKGYLSELTTSMKIEETILKMVNLYTVSQPKCVSIITLNRKALEVKLLKISPEKFHLPLYPRMKISDDF